MNENNPQLGVPQTNGKTAPLIERLDPALGEATTGISVLLTELVRRTLRGGIQKVDEELQSEVEQKVDATVASRLPRIEEAANKAAEETARTVATEKVDALGREVNEFTTEVRETTTRLAGEIVETEQRAEASARGLVEEQIALLKQKSKGTADTLFTHVKDLKEKAAALQQRVEETGAENRRHLDQVQQEIRQRIESAQAQVAQSLQTQQAAMEERLKSVLARNEELEARIAELEKPRGLKALFGKFRSKKKDETEDEPGEEME